MIAALFCRSGGIYSRLPGVDPWDIHRDARLWPGGSPCVAHPPCRAWGRYHHRAKPRPDEASLGPLAVRFVRDNGGLLEHPAASKLFSACRLPRPGEFPDEWGGYTLLINQSDFGHRALKPTWLYIVGVSPGDLPALPAVRPGPFVPVENMCRAEREATPADLALWLVQAAHLALR